MEYLWNAFSRLMWPTEGDVAAADEESSDGDMLDMLPDEVLG
jgi:hypothetical protein